MEAARSFAGIDPAQVGFTGASQAGWIAPQAAIDSRHVAFVALASPGILRYSIVHEYERFTGGEEGGKPRPFEEEIAKKLASVESSGYDRAPALWLFGGADRNVPPRQSAAVLSEIKATLHKNWTIIVYPRAGHGLFDTKPTDPRAAVRPRPASVRAGPLVLIRAFSLAVRWRRIAKELVALEGVLAVF